MKIKTKLHGGTMKARDCNGLASQSLIFFNDKQERTMKIKTKLQGGSYPPRDCGGLAS